VPPINIVLEMEFVTTEHAHVISDSLVHIVLLLVTQEEEIQQLVVVPIKDMELVLLIALVIQHFVFVNQNTQELDVKLPQLIMFLRVM